MKEREFRAFVDRVENGVAVLLLGEDERDTLNLPTEYLPNGVGEGAVLRITMRHDPEATEEASKRVSGLIDRLAGRSGDQSV